MNATDRAAEIGAEDGRKAAETWWANTVRVRDPEITKQLLIDRLKVGRWDFDAPEPDPIATMNRGYSIEQWDAYEAAYRAAVEETIREAVKS